MSQNPEPLYYVIYPRNDGGYVAMHGNSESTTVAKEFDEIEEALAWAESQSETADVLIQPECLWDALDSVVVIEVIDATTDEDSEYGSASG